jgi:hypothetical protein
MSSKIVAPSPQLVARWVGKPITLDLIVRYVNGMVDAQTTPGVLTSVNRFWVTVLSQNQSSSYPLKTVTLSWDDRQNRLKIIVEEMTKRM